MTGLSGAGKSTLATLLTQELASRGIHVECLDGDEVRKNLSHGLGFSREDRDHNVRRIGYVARMVARSGACAITAAISPYKALRDEIRAKTENFLEVYCECPIEVLTERDPKGLYKRALAGELKNFTGVDDPYEAPEEPEVLLHTDRSSPAECVAQILSALEERGLLSSRQSDARALAPPFGGEVFQARFMCREELPPCDFDLGVSLSIRENTLAVALGHFSPLSGFMTEREAVKVKKSGALESGAPWWEEPFILAAPYEEPQVGQRVRLLFENAPFAVVRVDQVWRDAADVPHVAGLIEAITVEEKLSVASREVRAQGRSLGQAPLNLFAEGPPSDLAHAQVKLAARLSPLTVLAVAAPHAAAWHTLDLGSAQLLVLPSAFPFKSEAARTVIQRSLGAHSNALLD
jgi:sulfate adenylyltransferase/3'-phosphoadenosine 5'-phosphosulfate synthase